MNLLINFLAGFVLVAGVFSAQPQDIFNYGGTVGSNYGPADWGKVTCENPETCPGWPDDWEKFNPFIPYEGSKNKCKDCSKSNSQECKMHKQSPIHLFRNVTSRRECHDRHGMKHDTGSCAFGQMSFLVERHALRAFQPMHQDGTIDCAHPSRIDFSMGFPEPWNLVFTDIKVPSEHTQDGKRYSAEVQMAHTYSVNEDGRLIGKVSIFLEADERAPTYDFLDLYIRRWNVEATLVQDACRRRNLLAEQSIETFRSNRVSDTKLEEDEFMGTRLLNTPPNPFRRKFHAYDWIRKAGTQYYFRYEGSQGVPPCLEVVHWRVIKDSIKVPPSQIRRLEELIANRINPETCRLETAGVPRANNPALVNVTRPMQTTTNAHKVVYCECLDWESDRPNDQAYCKLPMPQRGALRYWKLNNTLA